MSSVQEPHLHLEVGHILFLDIVGYSKLLADEQKELVQELNQIVRETEQFRAAEANGKLTRLPTGDGMVLVFTNNPEAPMECALEISKTLQSHPKLKVRMGIHSGPVNPIADVNDQANLLGAGINVAQRVMYCGDAGHILLSKRFAEDLEQYAHWRSHLHDVGKVTDKHSLRVPLVNLYTDQLGNSALPAKLRQARAAFRLKSAAVAALFLITALGVAFWMLRRSQERFMNAAGEIPYKSIAVLPFENLSRDPDNAYFAVGIQNEILTQLAKIGALKVISRVSTQQYPSRPGNLAEIARQLGAGNILEGSVQKAADQVHINVQLIRAATNEHVWAESYDRKLENIFGVEGEVAAAVAEALNAKLTGAEQQALHQKPTNNPEAYSAYLRGIALWGDPTNVDDIPQGEKAVQEAVRRDPNFAIAWAMLAQIDSDAYFSLETTSQRRAAAQSSLDTAMRLNPELPEVQVARAMYQFKVLREFDGAKRSFQQLETKLPNNTDILEALGQIALQLGQWQESGVYVDRAIGLNPRNLNLRLEAAWARQTMRDFPGALRCFDEALEIWPDQTALIAAKAAVYQLLGELDQADELLKKLPRTHLLPLTVNAIYHQAKLRRRYADGIGPLQTFLGETEQTDPIEKMGTCLAFDSTRRPSATVRGQRRVRSYVFVCS
jgi:TolB-like protein